MKKIWLLALSLPGALFAAEHVRFSLPSNASLALVQAFDAAKTAGVKWSAPASEWKNASCEVFLYRPAREDAELTLYDVNNRIECRGDAKNTTATLQLPLPKVGVQFYGNFRTHRSSTLVGEGVMEIGKALAVGRRNNIGKGMFEPLDLCDIGDYCISANDLMTQPKRWTGVDWDYGRTVLTCTLYGTGGKVDKSDCYVIDVTE